MPDTMPSDRNASRRLSSKTIAPQTVPHPDSALEALEHAVENERLRLLRARSVLRCISLAMESADGQNAGPLYFPAVIDLAADLVDEAVERLDSANLQPPLSDVRLFGRRRRSV